MIEYLWYHWLRLWQSFPALDLPTSQAFTVYDVEDPNAQRYPLDLSDVEPCEVPENAFENPENVHISVWATDEEDPVEGQATSS